jgi:hypothetical protein
VILAEIYNKVLLVTLATYLFLCSQTHLKVETNSRSSKTAQLHHRNETMQTCVYDVIDSFLNFRHIAAINNRASPRYFESDIKLSVILDD